MHAPSLAAVLMAEAARCAPAQLDGFSPGASTSANQRAIQHCPHRVPGLLLHMASRKRLLPRSTHHSMKVSAISPASVIVVSGGGQMVVCKILSL